MKPTPFILFEEQIKCVHVWTVDHYTYISCTHTAWSDAVLISARTVAALFIGSNCIIAAICIHYLSSFKRRNVVFNIDRDKCSGQEIQFIDPEDLTPPNIFFFTDFKIDGFTSHAQYISHSKIPPKVLSFNTNILLRKEYIYPSYHFYNI